MPPPPTTHVAMAPCMVAGVEWLTQKYKLYIVLRERLLMDTPQLRGSVTAARSGPESINNPAAVKRGAHVDGREMP